MGYSNIPLDFYHVQQSICVTRTECDAGATSTYKKPWAMCPIVISYSWRHERRGKKQTFCNQLGREMRSQYINRSCSFSTILNSSCSFSPMLKTSSSYLYTDFSFHDPTLLISRPNWLKLCQSIQSRGNGINSKQNPQNVKPWRFRIIRLFPSEKKSADCSVANHFFLIVPEFSVK